MNISGFISKLSIVLILLVLFFYSDIANFLLINLNQELIFYFLIFLTFLVGTRYTKLINNYYLPEIKRMSADKEAPILIKFISYLSYFGIFSLYFVLFGFVFYVKHLMDIENIYSSLKASLVFLFINFHLLSFVERRLRED